MKLKLMPLLTLLPLSLLSCGASGYVGEYSFQLGKNSGTHATAKMTLKNQDFVSEGKTYGKQMTVYGQVQTGNASSSSSGSGSAESSASSADKPVTPTSIITDALAEGLTIDGYYNIGKDLPEGRKNLRIGFDFPLLAVIFESDAPVTYDLIEKFIYCEIDSRKIYLEIPVSFTDLYFQLYWYGYDMPWLADIDDSSRRSSKPSSSSSSSASSSSSSAASESEPEVDPIHYPVTPHEAGTKPTQADIDEINKTYPGSHDGRMFRTYYTVSLALTRQ